MSAATDSDRYIIPAKREQKIPWQDRYSEAVKKKKLDKAVAAYRKHGTWGAAAKAAQIDRRTLLLWTHQNEMYKVAFEDADEGVTDDIEGKAVEKCMEGDPRMIAFMLSTRRKRYVNRQVVEVQQTLNLDNVVEKMRQIAIAQPTLKPTIIHALKLAIERIEA